MAESSNAPSAGRVNSLQSRLDNLHRSIEKERKRASRSSLLALIAAVLLLGLLGVYFYIGYRAFEEVKKPETIVTYVADQISQKLPEARHEVETQVKDQAPKLAEQLSTEAQRQTPVATKKITETVIDQAQGAIDQALGTVEEHFRAYLRQNKDMLDRKFDELRKNPTLAKKSLEELEVPLDAEFSLDMKNNARDVAWLFGSMTVNLKHLKNEKGLTPDEKQERRVWMLLRAMQLQAVDTIKDSPIMDLKK